MRLFLAVELPLSERERALRVIEGARQELPRARWSRREQMHLTLRFLGEVASGRVEEVRQVLFRVARSATELRSEVRVTGGGAFPSLERPRVLWLGIEPAAPLVALAGRIEESLRGLGFAAEERPYRAHLTVARVKESWPAEAGRQWADLAGAERLQSPWPVGGFHLVQSHLEATGARYETLASYPAEELS